jgi:hypothetical protein
VNIYRVYNDLPVPRGQENAFVRAALFPAGMGAQVLKAVSLYCHSVS